MPRFKSEVKHNVSVTLKLTKLESEILNKIVEEDNKAFFNNFNKSKVLRDLILEKFIEYYKNSFNELNIDTNNIPLVLKTIEDYGVENIAN